MRKTLVLIVLSLLLIVLFGTELSAQCPMCRISAESNLSNGGTAGQGLNAGILYLFATPYLVAGIIGFIWYRHRRNTRSEEPATLDSPSLN